MTGQRTAANGAHAWVEIIGLVISTYTRSVRMVCEEEGVAYKLTIAYPNVPEACALHPYWKIPVMRPGAGGRAVRISRDRRLAETRARGG